MYRPDVQSISHDSPCSESENNSHTYINFIKRTNRARVQSRAYKVTFRSGSYKVTRIELVVFLFIDQCGGLLSYFPI